jgi:hypothetical protein
LLVTKDGKLIGLVRTRLHEGVLKVAPRARVHQILSEHIIHVTPDHGGGVHAAETEHRVRLPVLDGGGQIAVSIGDLVNGSSAQTAILVETYITAIRRHRQVVRERRCGYRQNCDIDQAADESSVPHGFSSGSPDITCLRDEIFHFHTHAALNWPGSSAGSVASFSINLQLRPRQTSGRAARPAVNRSGDAVVDRGGRNRTPSPPSPATLRFGPFFVGT